MRLILVAALAFVPAAFAQPGVNPSGSYGNVLHPGVPSPGALRAPAPNPRIGGGGRIGGGRIGGGGQMGGGQMGGGQIGGGQIGGNGQMDGGRMGGGRIGGGGIGNGRRDGGRRNFGGGAIYIPYPVYGGYGMGYGFDGFYASDSPGVHNPAPGTYDPIFGGYNPGPGYAEPYPSEPFSAEPAPVPPTVIINQNFQTDSVRPQFRDYSNAQLPQPGAVAAPPAPPAPAAPPAALPAPASTLADNQPTIFLIAMQDHAIHPVIAYWVQGDTLNYISLEGVLNHVSVAQVDRDFSKQLNAERNVPFALPAAR